MNASVDTTMQMNFQMNQNGGTSFSANQQSFMANNVDEKQTFSPVPNNEEMDPHSILLNQLESSARNADASAADSNHSFTPENMTHTSPINTEITDDTIEMLLNGEGNDNSYQSNEGSFSNL